MTIQAYPTGAGSTFEAPLVPMATVQCIGGSDDGGARRCRTAPGSPGAFDPVRQAAPIGGDSNAVAHIEDPMEVNHPLRSGEKAAGGHDDGSHHDAWSLITTPAGVWKSAPPGSRDVAESWIQG